MLSQTNCEKSYKAGYEAALQAEVDKRKVSNMLDSFYHSSICTELLGVINGLMNDKCYTKEEAIIELMKVVETLNENMTGSLSKLMRSLEGGGAA